MLRRDPPAYVVNLRTHIHMDRDDDDRPERMPGLAYVLTVVAILAAVALAFATGRCDSERDKGRPSGDLRAADATLL